jgi:acyl carrier protein
MSFGNGPHRRPGAVLAMLNGAILLNHLFASPGSDWCGFPRSRRTRSFKAMSCHAIVACTRRRRVPREGPSDCGSGNGYLDDRIRNLVVRHLEVGPQEVVGLARLSTDLGADSLDKIELMMAFEDEFGCEITDEIADTILSVSDVRNFLERNAKR